MEKRNIIGVAWPGVSIDYLTTLLQDSCDSHFTQTQPPLLPWDVAQASPKVWDSRISRWERERKEAFVGDIAWYYIPYLLDFLSKNKTLKVVAVSGEAWRIAQDILEQTGTTLGGIHINNWSQFLAANETRNPLWARTFPKSDEREPLHALVAAVDLANRILLAARDQFPDQVLLLDYLEIGTDRAASRIRSFTGLIAKSAESIRQWPRRTVFRQIPPLPLSDPRQCVILVPFTGSIHTECELGLKELERRGYTVRRTGGYAAIDQGRNQMATDALVDGFDETLWIDADIGFHVDDVEKLRSHPHSIVCGIYPQKGRRALAVHVMPGTQTLAFGSTGGLIEILYAATGFLLVRREAYIRIQEDCSLPVCNERFNRPMIPWFQPMVRPINEGHWYLAEDFAFCHRARLSGMKIFADTSIRLWHIGNYRYGWEDAGLERERFMDFTLNLKGDR